MQNPRPDAKEEFLRVQQAYEALTRPGGPRHTSGAPNAATHQQRRAAWQRFWQQPRAPRRIHSDTEELDASAFYRKVLLQGDDAASTHKGSTHKRSGGSGVPSLPWLIQLYADSSPYCRVLSTHWEAAAREMRGLARFGRVDFEAQRMLVRFLASHLRLFSGPHPTAHELPLVVGFPAGCSAMACALVYQGRFTAAGLQRFAADRLLRLPPLRPISPRLLGPWRRAAAAAGPAGGGVAMLALLPEGQAQPLELLAAVAGAGGRLQAAATAVWRPADRNRWAQALGVHAAPALVFWRGGAAQPSAVVQGSLLTNRIDWAAEVARHAQQAVLPLTAGATAQQAPACLLGVDFSEQPAGSAPAAPPGALCVLLLGSAGAQLAGARAALEALHAQLVGSQGGIWGPGRVGLEERRVGKLLAGGVLQLAWASGGEQAVLCTHLLRWSGRGASIPCLCAPWWRRLPASMLGRCDSKQQQPVLLAYQVESAPSDVGMNSRRSRHGMSVAAFTGSLADGQSVVAWLAALGDGGQRRRLLLPAPPLDVPLPAAAAAGALPALLLWLLHVATRSERLWIEAAGVARAVAGSFNWRQAALLALSMLGLLGFKRLLDILSGSDDEEGVSDADSPVKCSTRQVSRHAARLVREMQQSDWEPSPGRLLVVLPLPGPGGSGAASADNRAQQERLTQQCFASLATIFQRERRLVFRVASVSSAFAALLTSADEHSRRQAVQQSALDPPQQGQAVQPAQQAQQQQQQLLQEAVLLHPRRDGRFQLLPLGSVQQAALRLEDVLDGGGVWRQGSAAAR